MSFDPGYIDCDFIVAKLAACLERLMMCVPRLSAIISMTFDPFHFSCKTKWRGRLHEQE